MRNIDVENSFNQQITNGAAIRPASLTFDSVRYRTEVDQFDITEAQKLDLLNTLWSIMRSFVELGFTVDVCAALLADQNPIPGDDELR